MSVKIGNIDLGEFPLLLAPMEDVSDPPFRYVCKANGVDMMYTEFISSEGLIRDAAKSRQKLDIFEYERPVGIQIFGSNIESMREATEIASQVNPDPKDPWVTNSRPPDHDAIYLIFEPPVGCFFYRIHIAVTKNRDLDARIAFNITDEGPVCMAFIHLSTGSAMDGKGFDTDILQPFGNFIYIQKAFRTAL